jgi:hypothetical protein
VSALHVIVSIAPMNLLTYKLVLCHRV